MNHEIRKLILDNPDLPIIVACGEEANSGEYSVEVHHDYACYITECLWFGNKYFDDKDELVDYILENIMDETTFDTFFNDREREEWAHNYIKEEKLEFKKYIVIHVG